MKGTIRRATTDDLEAVRVLLRETWHATYDELYGAEEVERLTADWHSIESMEQRTNRPHSLFLVAEDGERVVGMAFAAEEEPRTLFLHQLYVLPGDQSRGIGSALLLHVEDGFPGAERIRLDVEVANRKAVGFYGRRGFGALGLEAETSAPKMMRMERLLLDRRRDGHSDAGAP